MPDDPADMALPSYSDFCPLEPPTLDAVDAAKEFMGKSLVDAEVMFREKCIHHCDDLSEMGTRAFEFYVKAFRNYLFSEQSTGDYTVECFFDSTIPHRLRFDDGLGNARTVVLECLDYVLENFDRFDIEDVAQPDLAETFDSIINDGTMREIMEEMWENLHGQPLQTGELEGMVDDLKKSQSLMPAEEKLATRQRWMKLREEVGSSI